MGGGGGLGDQNGCERRVIEVFVKIQVIQKKIGGGGVVVGGGGSGRGRVGRDQVGCKRRIIVFV